jgi:EAL domain-containing protein (putative c-di-GMP-specific phosphodiesterase class I)
VIGAGEFVPWAERTGLVRDLSRFVVDRGVAECTEWERLGVEVEVAVNLTAFDLLDATLPDFVAETLARHGLEACRLVLEVTEGTIVVDEARAAGVLRALAALGVRVAIDDFGVGYSSVSHLQRLPFSEVKIDRSFVDGVTTDQKSLAIVQWTVDLASAIGMSVVAEGVETEEQLQVVTAAGCHRAQGFLLGEPLPAAAVRAQIGRFVDDGSDAAASLAA